MGSDKAYAVMEIDRDRDGGGRTSWTSGAKKCLRVTSTLGLGRDPGPMGGEEDR